MIKESACPLVSVIVPNFNGKAFLKNCIDSLLNQTYANYEVIMVDNASIDGSSDYIATNFPWIKVIQNNINLGYAEGNNIGAKYVNGEYLVFLNNDTLLDSRWLEELVKVAMSDPSIGVVGCKVLDFDKKTIHTVGSSIDILGFPFSESIEKVDNIKDVFLVSGVAFLVKRKIFETLEGFDSEYFAYIEEFDLFWRTQLLGYRVVSNPFSRVYHHKVGMTTGKMSYNNKRFLSERNTLRSLVKNYSLLTLLRILPTCFAVLFAEFLFFVVKKEVGTALAYAQAVLWNIRKFKSTWWLHNKIQQMRVLDDNTILRRMIHKSVKFKVFLARN